MNLNFDFKLAQRYKSPSQKIRVLSEDWTQREGYCPQCGGGLYAYKNNNPVGDYCCQVCNEDYELKAKNGKVGKKINDGAYRTMIERLACDSNPNFFFMSYDANTWKVENYIIIPKHFFTSEIIEKRKPLLKSAKRAGWIGCSILLSGIPASGKIYYVKNGIASSKSSVLSDWQKTIFLRDTKGSELKGWILDVMNCIDKLGKQTFKLDEMYAFADELARIHPDNKHIKDKIRQQLQFLRDRGYLEFVNKGIYRLT